MQCTCYADDHTDSTEIIKCNLCLSASILFKACKMLIAESKYMRQEYSDMDSAVEFADKAITKAEA